MYLREIEDAEFMRQTIIEKAGYDEDTGYRASLQKKIDEIHTFQREIRAIK